MERNRKIERNRITCDDICGQGLSLLVMTLKWMVYKSHHIYCLKEKKYFMLIFLRDLILSKYTSILMLRPYNLKQCLDVFPRCLKLYL